MFDLDHVRYRHISLLKQPMIILFNGYSLELYAEFFHLGIILKKK